MTFLRFLFLSLLLLCPVEDLLAGGGAWVKTKSGYYFKIGFTSLTAEQEYGFGGEDRPLFSDTTRFANGRIGISNITLYSEYGLTDWLTSVVSTYYSVIVREADIIEQGMEGLTETESASGLGDTWIGARVNLLPREWKVAGAATVSWKIPTGSPNKEVPLGSGVADYEAAIGFGTGFRLGEERFGYTQVSGGYRLRNKASSEFIWQMEAGAALLPTVGLQASLNGTHSTADFNQAAQNLVEDPSFNELVGSQTFTQFSGGVIYSLTDLMDLTALYTTTLSGMNTLNAGSFSIGIAWKNR